MLATAESNPTAGAGLASDIVELVVLTSDGRFLQTLRDAVEPAHRLGQIAAAAQMDDLLQAGQVGILVLDLQALPDSASVFIAKIKHRFPAIVVLVAGHRDVETPLAHLISAGAVYRFIHKPLSPARAKLFADAAVRKYQEQRRHPASPQHYPASRRRGLRAAIGLAAVLAVCATLWTLWHGRAAANRAPEPRFSTVAEGSIPVEGAQRAGSAGLEAAAPAPGVAIEEHDLSQARGANSLPAGRSEEATVEPASRAGADQNRVDRFLKLAAERIKQGRLSDPGRDGARFYVEQALAIEPGGNAVQAAKQTLAHALLSEAHAAVEQRDFTRAASLADAADGIAAAANVENVRQLVSAGRKSSAEEAENRLLRNAQERLQQDRLVQPADDSAKYYLLTLRDLDAGYAGLAQALQDLGLRIADRARRAVEQKEYAAARTWLDEAAAVGFSSPEATAAAQAVDAALNRQRFLANVVDAGTLSLVTSTVPRYPIKAQRAALEGWVELDFTVDETGTVHDIAVHAAQPRGVFDKAASDALLQWRYKPVLHDALPVAQRCRIRMQFVMTGRGSGLLQGE